MRVEARAPFDIYLFFEALLRTMPDHFGRFRACPLVVHFAVFPLREASCASLAHVRDSLEFLERNGIWRAWVIGGVRFGELIGERRTGRVAHSTPEPPWSKHQHTGACAPMAIRQARIWGAPPEVISDLRRLHGASRRRCRRGPDGRFVRDMANQ